MLPACAEVQISELTTLKYLAGEINSIMIQRIQSIWLLLAGLCAFITYTLTLYNGRLPDGTIRQFPLADNFFLGLLFIVTGAIAIGCIFLFKNRKLQFRLSIIGVILSIAAIFLEYMKVEEFKLINKFQTGTYQVGALLPIGMVLFFILAARAIYRDEKLVKSVDRLR